MDLSVTEKTYSGDNYDQSLCVLADGVSCWMAWAAYEKDGSRAFIRKFDGGAAGPILRLSDNENMQARPLCVPIPTGTTFVWFEKVGHTYAIWGRRDNGGELTKPAMLHALPEGAKPWELQAQSDESGSLWLTWAQAVKGKNTVEVLRVAVRLPLSPDGRS